MDRTTVTALLKALKRRGLVASAADAGTAAAPRRDHAAGPRPARRGAADLAREHAQLEAALRRRRATGRDLLRALSETPLPYFAGSGALRNEPSTAAGPSSPPPAT